MVTFNGYDVELSRGDTLALKIELDGRDLPEGTDGVFTIKKRINMDEVVLQKRFDASDEVLTVVLDADETNIVPGTYYWDVRLQIPLENGGYEVYTPMEYAAFVVLPVVGVDIGTDGSNMVNPDLPVLQVALAEMRKAIQDANDATDGANAAKESADKAAGEAANAAKAAELAAQEAGMAADDANEAADFANVKAEAANAAAQNAQNAASQAIDAADSANAASQNAGSAASAAATAAGSATNAAEKANTSAKNADTAAFAANAAAQNADEKAALAAESAADYAKVKNDVNQLKDELSRQVANSDIRVALLADTIPNTTQQYVFDTDGAISRINHTRDGQAVRVDAYVFTEEMIKETRTLSTGESLTITTNLTTLETNVAYAAPV